jgi:hypothetical protein
MLIINPVFYPQVKNKPCVHWAYEFIIEDMAPSQTIWLDENIDIVLWLDGNVLLFIWYCHNQ